MGARSGEAATVAAAAGRRIARAACTVAPARPRLPTGAMRCKAPKRRLQCDRSQHAAALVVRACSPRPTTIQAPSAHHTPSELPPAARCTSLTRSPPVLRPACAAAPRNRSSCAQACCLGGAGCGQAPVAAFLAGCRPTAAAALYGVAAMLPVPMPRCLLAAATSLQAAWHRCRHHNAAAWPTCPAGGRRPAGPPGGQPCGERVHGAPAAARGLPRSNRSRGLDRKRKRRSFLLTNVVLTCCAVVRQPDGRAVLCLAGQVFAAPLQRTTGKPGVPFRRAELSLEPSQCTSPSNCLFCCVPDDVDPHHPPAARCPSQCSV